VLEGRMVAIAGSGEQLGLGRRLEPDRADEFVLMVSEAVTNAVEHGEPEGDGRIGLRLEADNGVLRVAVSDAVPGSISHAMHSRSGNLTTALDELADRWGLSVDGKKAVWFEIDTAARTV
jgi:anti-sigma regulatory factor (Ser/Thr protein kinase)